MHCPRLQPQGVSEYSAVLHTALLYDAFYSYHFNRLVLLSVWNSNILPMTLKTSQSSPSHCAFAYFAMKAEEVFEFDQTAYAAQVANDSTQRLQEQEIFKTRQIIKALTSVSNDTITAIATAGATLLMPIYSARQYDVAKKKLAIIQGELTKRRIPVHKPDSADANAAMLGFVAGEVVGDAVGDVLPVSMPDDSFGSVMMETAGGEWGDLMAEKAIDKHEANKISGSKPSSRLQAYPLATEPPPGTSFNLSTGSQTYPSNTVPPSGATLGSKAHVAAALVPTMEPMPSGLGIPSGLHAYPSPSSASANAGLQPTPAPNPPPSDSNPPMLARPTEPAPTGPRIPYGPDDYPLRPSVSAYGASGTNTTGDPPPYSGSPQPDLAHSMADMAIGKRDPDNSLSTTSATRQQAYQFPADSKAQPLLPSIPRKPTPSEFGKHSRLQAYPVSPVPDEQAGLIPTSTINPPPYPGYSQQTDNLIQGSFPPNNFPCQLPPFNPSARAALPPLPLPQQQHRGKSHRLQCGACSMFFDGAFTKYLCKQPPFHPFRPRRHKKGHQIIPPQIALLIASSCATHVPTKTYLIHPATKCT